MFNPNLIGPDCSFYQDPPSTPQHIDFNKMKSAGAEFVILRAGQNSWVDSAFSVGWILARQAALMRGAYFFYDSRQSPEAQADLFLSTVGNDLPECNFWLDLEESYNGTYKGWPYWKRCLARLRNNASRPVGIYTGPAYWSANRPTSEADLAYFRTFPLWIANYGVSVPSVPYPWQYSDTIFWQYTSKGNGPLYGAESLNIDLNQFNGTREDFLRFTGSNVPLPDGDGMQVIQGTALCPVKIRSAIWGSTIGYLYTGDTIEADRHEMQWLHLTKVNGTLLAQESWASAGSSQQYISWKWVTIPDPEPVPEPTPDPFPPEIGLVIGDATKWYVPKVSVNAFSRVFDRIRQYLRS